MRIINQTIMPSKKSTKRYENLKQIGAAAGAGLGLAAAKGPNMERGVKGFMKRQFKRKK